MWGLIVERLGDGIEPSKKKAICPAIANLYRAMAHTHIQKSGINLNRASI